MKSWHGRYGWERIVMVFRIIRKLFDPNYATKQVEAIRKDSNKKLKKASKSADRLTEAAKSGDTLRVMFIAAGGKK